MCGNPLYRSLCDDLTTSHTPISLSHILDESKSKYSMFPFVPFIGGAFIFCLTFGLFILSPFESSSIKFFFWFWFWFWLYWFFLFWFFNLFYNIFFIFFGISYIFNLILNIWIIFGKEYNNT